MHVIEILGLSVQRASMAAWALGSVRFSVKYLVGAQKCRGTNFGAFSREFYSLAPGDINAATCF